MPIILGLGGEWGDEAKGKGCLKLAENCEIAAKVKGSNNAGNQAVKDGVTHKFSLLPTGMLLAHIRGVIGRGMLLNQKAFIGEIDRVSTSTGSPIIPRLSIAPEAHILSQAHIALDKKMEAAREVPVGTTLRGVGPSVMGKDGRINMRMEELQRTTNELKDRYGKFLKDMESTFGVHLDSAEEGEDLSWILQAQERLGDRVIPNTIDFWIEEIAKKTRILIVGSQGFELAIDGQGYPFVTSNDVTAHGHLSAAGLPASEVTEHYEFIKAYTTRVGGGPRLTPMPDAIADRVQTEGKEFGTQTGRARTAFWPSTVRLGRMLFADKVNKEHPPQLALMKLDVLDVLDEIKVEVDQHPTTKEPIYKTFPGWKQSTKGITKFEDLPENAQNYVRFFEKKFDRDIPLIGTGPDHEEIIDRRKK